MSIHDLIHGMFVGGYVACGLVIGFRPGLVWFVIPILLIVFAADFVHREAITPDRWDQ